MAKKIIRLTEGDLHRIVKESVNRILKEVRDNSISDEEWDEINQDYLDSGFANDDPNSKKDLENELGYLDWEREELRDKGDSAQSRIHPQVDSNYGRFHSVHVYPGGPFHRAYLKRGADNIKKYYGL